MHISFQCIKDMLPLLSYSNFKKPEARRKKNSSLRAEACRVVKNSYDVMDSQLLIINSDFVRGRENWNIRSERPSPEDSVSAGFLF